MLTVGVRSDLVTLHPGRVLVSQRRTDSSHVRPVNTDVGAGEVTLTGGDVHAARSVGRELGSVRGQKHMGANGKNMWECRDNRRHITVLRYVLLVNTQKLY